MRSSSDLRGLDNWNPYIAQTHTLNIRVLTSYFPSFPATVRDSAISGDDDDDGPIVQYRLLSCVLRIHEYFSKFLYHFITAGRPAISIRRTILRTRSLKSADKYKQETLSSDFLVHQLDKPEGRGGGHTYGRHMCACRKCVIEPQQCPIICRKRPPSR